MKELKIILIVVASVLLITAGIILSVTLPKEGHIVEYRLEHSSGAEIGYYPSVRVVVEDGLDYYMYFPDLTMEEGMQKVESLNRSLKRQ